MDKKKMNDEELEKAVGGDVSSANIVGYNTGNIDAARESVSQGFYRARLIVNEIQTEASHNNVLNWNSINTDSDL